MDQPNDDSQSIPEDKSYSELLADFNLDEAGMPLQKVRNNAPAALPMFGRSTYQPKLTDEQRASLEQYFDDQVGRPVTSMAMICRWNSCGVKHACPLYRMAITPNPEGLACPVEENMIHQDIQRLKTHLGVSDDNIVDISVIKEIAALNIYIKRIQEEMSLDPKIMRQTFGGKDAQGNPMTVDTAHPSMNIIDKISKEKRKLWESLIATREAKAKDQSNKTRDFAEMMKVIHATAEKKRREADKARLIEISDNDLLLEAGVVPSNG